MDESIRKIRREQWLRSQNNKRQRDDDECDNSGSSNNGKTGFSASTGATIKRPRRNEHTSPISSSSSSTILNAVANNNSVKKNTKPPFVSSSHQDAIVDLTNDDDDDDNINNNEPIIQSNRPIHSLLSSPSSSSSVSSSSSASSLSLLSYSSPSPKSSGNICNDEAKKKSPPRRKAVRPKTKKSITTTTKANTNARNKNNNNNNNNNNTKKNNKKTSTPSSFSFSVCTYNIWFGPPHPSKRMEEIARLLLQQQHTSSTSSFKKPKPLFIGLQEVTPELAMELFPLLQSCGYYLTCQDLRSEGGGSQYGCAVAVLTEKIGSGGENEEKDKDERVVEIVSSGFVPYKDTIMNRGFVFVHGRIVMSNLATTTNESQQQPAEVLFVTTHLESFVPNFPTPGRNYDGVKERELQMKQMTSFCDKYLSKNKKLVGAFVTGDLNWDDERKRSMGVDKPLLSLLNDDGSGANRPWVDAWKVNQGEKAEGYTYDSKINPMLRGNLRRRFDRILIREKQCGDKDSISTTAASSSSSSLCVKSTNLFGMEPISGLEWKKEVKPWGSYGASSSASSIQIRPVLPSDHFGLWAVMDYSSL